jgi:HAE1 family hydrophobic/amphiphilic exporter-1
MSSFFLSRPIFAAVLSAVILTIGIAAIPNLPIAQFPPIAPPTIVINSSYPGANAEEVESAVTTPIEEAINGSQGLNYISSVSGDDGTSAITATFNLTRDIDNAATDVLVAIQTASGEIPAVVKTQGVTVSKTLGSLLMSVSLFSDDPKYGPVFLSNYASLQVVDPLKRISGVGTVSIFGQRTYAMRIWLDPKKLSDNGLTTGDVTTALTAQNVQVPAGAFGQEPTPKGQPYYIGVRVVGQLVTPQDFGNVILRSTPQGGYVRIRDVGYTELGADSYTSTSLRNGKLTIGLGIQQLPSANALQVSAAVLKEMSVLERRFPPGVHWGLNFDTTDFVRESMKEVVITLLFSILLVVIVIYVFLQDWRTTLIPAITIPVSLVGTFGLISALGFSINTLTLFGLTLATGLVVDDAIVVIENITRFTAERKDGDKVAAAEGAMKEITGAVVATSLVLLAVFIPVGFFPGTTGELYKQFALTIAASIAISLFVALTLTPALAVLLVPASAGDHKGGPIFGPINRVIDATRRGYENFLNTILPFKWIVAAVFVASLVITLVVFTSTPTGFLPDEDQGIIYVTIQLPLGSSLEQEEAVGKRANAIVSKLPGVALVFNISGRGIGGSGNGTNVGFLVVRLKPWSERTAASQQVGALIAEMRPKLAAIPSAQILAFNPPAVQGIGSIGGFQYELENPSNGSYEPLSATATKMIAAANRSGHVVAANTTFALSAPHYVVTVDREKAEAAGVSVGDIFDALQSEIGSKYINDFTYSNRVYHVYIQATQDDRARFEDLQKIFVRSSGGQATPLTSYITTAFETSPPLVTHYNLFRNIEITGQTPPGQGSGQSLGEMEQLSKQMLGPFAHEWSGISLEQIQGGGAAALIFGLGLLFVFFVLAAQYESLSEPFIILLATPVAILGALVGLHLRGISSDVYAQVGYVMLIGLASKNAILIVEFANQLRERGMSAVEAVTRAAETRLRPILMTSFAFILGILPLVFANGAGAASRHSLGTAVFGGMLVSTILNLGIIPALYIIVAQFDHSHDPKGEHGTEAPAKI